MANQQYFFETPLFPNITDLDTPQHVGINDDTPENALDVNGTITASSNIMAGSNIIATHNLVGSNLLVSYTIAGNHVSANSVDANSATIDDITAIEITASNVVASNVVASNVYSSNVTTIDVDTQHLNLYDPAFSTTSNFQGLIHINGYDMSQPFPDSEGLINGIDWWFNSERQGSPIHPSWIQDDQNILADLWNAGELGVDIAQTLADAYQFFQGTGQEVLTQAALEGLNQALDNLGDETQSNQSKIIVSWGNIKNRPLANSSKNIGVDGDLYIAPTKSIKVLDGGSFDTDAWSNVRFNTTPSGTTLINCETKEAFFKYLQLSHEGQNTLFTPTEIVTDCNFKVGSINIHGSNIYNSASNILINGITLCNDDLGEALVKADKIYATRLVDYTGKGSSLMFYGSETWLKQQNTANPDTNTWRMSTLVLKDSELKYLTYPSVADGGAIATEQFKIDSNGIMTVRSNLVSSNITACNQLLTNKITSFSNYGTLQFNSSNIVTTFSNINASTLYQNTDALEYWTTSNSLSPVKQFAVSSNGEAYVRSNVVMPFTATLRAVTAEQEGIMRMTSNTFRFLTSNNTREDIWFSVNSNGMFLPNKSSIYSKNETFSMPNPINPLEPFSFTTFARFDMGLSNGFTFGWNLSNDVLTDSNYDLFNVTRFAEVKTLNKRDNLMTTCISSNAEWVGEINTTRASSISNLTCFNVNACNLMENNQSLSFRYAGSNALSNVNSNLIGFSNWSSPIIQWGSNNTSNLPALYAPSNAMSNWNWGSNTASWGSNALSNYSVNATLSNYGLKTQTDWTSNSLTNYTLKFGLGGGISVSNIMTQPNVIYTESGTPNKVHINTPNFSSISPQITCTSALRVGIHTQIPQETFHVEGNTLIRNGGYTGLKIKNSMPNNIDQPAEVVFDRTELSSSLLGAVGMDRNPRNLFVWVNGADRLNIDTSGKSVFSGALWADSNIKAKAKVIITPEPKSDTYGWAVGTTVNSNLGFFYSGDNRYLEGLVDGGSNAFILRRPSHEHGKGATVYGDLLLENRGAQAFIQAGLVEGTSYTNWTQFEMAGTDNTWFFWDNLQASGSITGSSKNFVIESPLNSEKVLIHTCIESPRADLHYSGRVKLDKGKATVKIDIESCENSPMTIGTFEALTKNARVYLQNNSSFSRVKGKVVFGILEIECEDNKSRDEIDWLVIAERNDKDFKTSKMANSKGSLITEGLKKDWMLNEENKPTKQTEKREKEKRDKDNSINKV